ncbi:HD domain-containing protein [Kitasatospora viridis]|uniref:Histidine kinase/DNA gyrase B/HSP90-like ATPase n=1 Tax=Kitasatospora viridis TaxID=281105 RepID=A0A561UIV2_9ACTN|nr:ATP-binding protein [Kitasatospora viridis]TWF99301.1 hypothetical protein FHX73_113144 [Kitasatospora viridis]
MVQENVTNSMSGGSARNVVQAGFVGAVNFYQDRPAAEPVEGDEWARLVHGSAVWQHVADAADAQTYRAGAVAVARELAKLRDEAGERLAGDPWQDPGVVVRFLRNVEWLLGGEALGLSAAEAALLVVAPLLYRVRTLRLAAEFAEVREGGGGEARASYERFAETYDLLTHRAELRPEAEDGIGWWLFHRWLTQHQDLAEPHAVRELLAEAGAGALAETFAVGRVCALLHGIRRGPDVGNREFLGGLKAEDRVAGPGGRGQRVRDRWLSLLLALAYGVSIESTALPDIVAEHLGIPHAVELAQLRDTLERAVWGGTRELPVLRAECRHEAVVEGLREYVARADELLHAVHREWGGELPALPVRLSSDETAPAEGTFARGARFRLDERRVRGLLMGTQLYKDRDLAVRELYQNALDACRYRLARTEYLDRSSAMASYRYEGKIEFEQGVEDGRPYLECRDNGVGMGEAELRGVFSNAGARFAEQLDFKLEQAQWREVEPPVVLYPNSRFGIGVLSYFMLADEIRVRTCRMDAKGQLGPELEVSIFGPGHLFRIVEKARRGQEPGTAVRLYLRELPEDWSAVAVLERLLGIAEFGTVARDGEREVEWEAGQLRSRPPSHSQKHGYNAAGEFVSWSDAPAGAQVIWCETGGALLVDGIFVESSSERGVLSTLTQGLQGAVVNLYGELSPTSMTVDRREVLDDNADQVGALLAAGVDSLIENGRLIPTFEWICALARESTEVADMVAAAASRAGRPLMIDGTEFRTSITGCLPLDPSILHPTHTRNHLVAPEWPDSLLLWRLIAHRPISYLDALSEAYPILSEYRTGLPALPSDVALFPERSSDQSRDIYALTSRIREATARTVSQVDHLMRLRLLSPLIWKPGREVSTSQLLEAAAALRLNIAMTGDLLRSLGLEIPAETLSLAGSIEGNSLLRNNSSNWSWLTPGGEVPPGALADISLHTSTPTSAIALTLAACGLQVTQGAIPEEPSRETVLLLSDGGFGMAPWLDPSKPVSPSQVLAAADSLDWTPSRAAETLSSFGFHVSPLPEDADVADLYLFRILDDEPPSMSVTYENVFFAAEEFYSSLQDTVDRLMEYGIKAPLRLPASPSTIDDSLLSTEGPVSWEDVVLGTPLPFARVVAASAQLPMPPEEIALLINSYGVTTSHQTLPLGLPLATAQELVRLASGNVTLATLLNAHRAIGAPILQIASWLRDMGVPVPDVRETILAALARVPMATRSGDN